MECLLLGLCLIYNLNGAVATALFFYDQICHILTNHAIIIDFFCRGIYCKNK